MLNIRTQIRIWSPPYSFSSNAFFHSNKLQFGEHSPCFVPPFLKDLTKCPLIPAWNSLESLTQISHPLSLNNRFATELCSLSRAKSLTRVSSIGHLLTVSLSLVWRKSLQVLHIVITWAVFLMYPQTDLGRWKWETAVGSMWLFHAGGVYVHCIKSVYMTEQMSTGHCCVWVFCTF